MQTFLPYHPIESKDTGTWDFNNTAEVLDNKRLNKQVIEAAQILDILCGKYADNRMRNHPAILQWKGHEWMMLDYLTNMCMECRTRDIRCSTYNRLNGYIMGMPHNSSQDLPEWMGRPEIFASHRSRLLFKGRCDAALQALKTLVKLPKNVTIRFWLISNDSPIVVSNEYVKTKMMQHRDVEQIEEHLFAHRCDIPPNFYRQYKWTEPDNIPYVWPITIAAIKEQAMRDAATAKQENESYSG